MKKKTTPPAAAAQQRIAELVSLIQEAERELQSLTGGELDAAAVPGDKPILLREAQEQLQISEAAQRVLAEMQTGILNALPAHVALLNSQGMIVAVNEAWRRFATANILQSADFFVGQNYLEVCEKAQGECAEEAKAVAKGIRQVLRRETREFALEYPCHSPTEKRWFRLMVSALSDKPETGAVVMHLNVTERRLAEEALKESESRLGIIFNESAIAVALVDTAGHPFLTNPACQRMLGYTGEELSQMSFSEFTHPDDRDLDLDLYRKLVAGQIDHYKIEKRYFRKDGRLVWGRLTVNLIRETTGQPKFALALVEDITERKQAEIDLVGSARKIRELFTHMPVGLVSHASDTAVLFVNPTAAQLLGHTPEEILGKTAADPTWRFLREDGTRMLPEEYPVSRALNAADGTVSDLVHGIWRPDREDPIWVQCNCHTLWKPGGEIEQVIVTFSDVTERREARIRLLRINRIYMVLSRVNELIVRTKDRQKLFESLCRIAVDEGLLRMAAVMEMDATSGECRPLCSAGVEEGFLSEISVNVSKPGLNQGTIGTAIRTGRYDVCNDTLAEPRMVTWRESLKRHRYFSTASFPLRLDENKAGVFVLFADEKNYFQADEIELLVAVSEDISHACGTLRAEEALRERQSLLSSAERIGRMGTWNLNLQTGQLLWSEATCEIFGIAPAEFAGTIEHFTSFILPEDRPVCGAEHARVAPSRPFLEVQYRIRRADGEVRWLYERGNVQFDAAGRQTRRLGVVMDITDRRQTEAQLQKLSLAVEQSPDSIEITDPTGKIEYANPKFLEQTGYTEAEVIGKNPRMFKAGDMPPETYRQLWETITAGKVWRGELHNRKKNGETYWENVSISPVLNPAGNITHFVAVKEDMTEKRAMAEKMRRNEEILRIAGRIAKLGAWSVDLPAGDVRWSEEVYAIYDLPPGSKLTLEERFDYVVPECRETIHRAFADCAREGKPYDLELEMMTAKGRRLWIRTTAEAEFDSAGKVRRVQGAIQDITERKAAEAALAAAHRNRDLILTSIGEGIHGLDLDGRINFENRAALAMLGYEEKELIGRPAHTTIHHHRADGSLYPVEECAIYLTLRDGRPRQVPEEVFFRKDGSRFFVSYVCWPVRDESHAISGAVVVFQDITERKHLEGEKQRAIEQLRQSEAEYRLLFKNNPQPMWVYDLETLQFLSVNQAAVLHYGYSEEEFLAMSIKDLRPAEDLPAVLSVISTPKENQKSSGQWRHLKKDGSLIDVEISSDQIVFNGRPARLALAIDVTKRLRGEIEVARTNRALKLLTGCNEALIRADKVTDFLFAICQMAVEIGGYRMAWIGYAQEDAERRITPVAQAGDTAGYLTEIKLSWSPHHPAGNGPAGRCIRNGQIVVCEDLEKDEDFAYWREPARLRGYRASIMLPLIEAGRTFAVLGLYSHEVIQRNEEELKLLQDLAEDLAFGIRHLRAKLEREMADTKIREQATLLDSAHEAILVKDMEDRIVYWNKGAERIYGWTAPEVLGRKSCDLLYVYPDSFNAALKILMANGEWNGEMAKLTKDGRKVTMDVSWTLVRDESGRPKSILAINADITEKKKLEQQFFRAQRMESIGTLASGIAHDLNNAIAPILMGVAVLEQDEARQELREVLQTIRASAQHCADLVKQVLTFSRGQEGQRMAVDVTTVVKELVKVARETFPKNIEVEINAAPNLWTVTADPTQIHQVVINLCVNARDAMPHGGKITIDLENQTLDEIYAHLNPQAKPGAFVIISVADTGEGIPAEIQDRIFDPFFTTKEVGKGTGLGLSTVLGIVKSHGGFINLYSEKGRGSTFKVYLPATAGAAQQAAAADEQTKLPRGHGELILVVDDEENVRNIVKRALERFGYRIVLANNGAEAISLYAQMGKQIAVVLTDMSMPIMDGPTTIVALKSMDPEVVIVGSSGLDANGKLAKAVGAGVKYFIPKPYSAEEILKVLAEAVAEAGERK